LRFALKPLPIALDPLLFFSSFARRFLLVSAPHAPRAAAPLMRTTAVKIQWGNVGLEIASVYPLPLMTAVVFGRLPFRKTTKRTEEIRQWNG